MEEVIIMKAKRITILFTILAIFAISIPMKIIHARANSEEKTISMAKISAMASHVLGEQKSPISDDMDISKDDIVNAADLVFAKRLALGYYIPTEKEDITLLINEICASNSNTLADKHGNYGDWIEIFNYSQTESVNLKGLGLSDNPEKPFKYVFRDVILGPGEYLVVFASDSSDGDDEEIHTDFNLSADGEYVVITHSEFGTIDIIEFPPLATDITYGRYANASDTFKPLTPTAGMSNDLAEIANNPNQVEAPVFSHSSGFYNSNFNLTMSSSTPDVTIYYTISGYDPTIDSHIYNSSIEINDRSGDQNEYSTIPDTSVYSTYIPSQRTDKAAVIRAIAVDADGNISKISTATYFVGDNYAEKYKNFSVISVVSDPVNLYDYNTGIFVKGAIYDQNKPNQGWGWPSQDDGSTPANYNQRGREWERTAFFDFFDSSHNLVISSDCGIRIHGGWSRAYLQKSLRFIARKEYGQGKFKAELIPGLVKESDGSTPITEFDKFIIRNGGNACDYVKFKCAYIQKLLEDRSFDTQGSNPVVAYMDGEYWGLYMLREDYDDNYVEANYDVPKEEVIIIKNNSIDEGDEQSDLILYNQLIDFALNNDMTIAENYEAMCSMIDIQSFADYYAAEIFIDNADWPHNNYRIWRSRNVDPSNPYQDGKWRWMLYDTEMSMDLYKKGAAYYNDTLNKLIINDRNQYGNQAAIFASLIKNEEFKEIFTTAYMDIVNVNFNYDSAMELLSYYENLYMPLINDQFMRFGPDYVLNPTQYVAEQIEYMRYFIKNRIDYSKTMLQENLGLGSAYELTLSSSDGGKIIINNSTLDLSNTSWTGSYFSDYSITLTAVPDSGKTFSGWSGASSSNEATITLKLSQAMSLRANFE